MKFINLVLGGFVSTALAIASSDVVAYGQLSVTPFSIRGQTINSANANAILPQSEFSINLEDCRNNNQLELTIRGMPTDRSNIDIWTGGSNCNDQNARLGTGTVTCTQVKTSPPTSSEPVPVARGATRTEIVSPPFGIGVKTLFNLNCDADPPPNATTVSAFFLAVNQAGGNDAVTAQQYVKLDYPLDFFPPVAPTGLKGGSGWTQIPLNWDDQSKNGDDLYGTYVFMDPTFQDASIGDGSDAVVASGDAGAADCDPALATILKGNQPVSSDIKPIQKLENSTANSARVDLQAQGVPLGKWVVLGVASVDRARNVGILSNLTCVKTVKSQGFYSTTNSPSGVGCSVSHRPRSLFFFASIFTPAGFMLWWWNRRRTRITGK